MNFQLISWFMLIWGILHHTYVQYNICENQATQSSKIDGGVIMNATVFVLYT